MSKNKCKPKKKKKGGKRYDFDNPESVTPSDMYSMGLAALIEAQNIASKKKSASGLVQCGTAWAAIATHIAQMTEEEDPDLPFGFGVK